LGHFLSLIIEMSRAKKRFFTLIVDTFTLLIVFWLAFVVRLEERAPFYDTNYWLLYICVCITSLFVFARVGLYRAVLRYLHFHALGIILVGSLASTASLMIFAFYLEAPIPRSVPIIYLSFCLVFIGGLRVIARGIIGKESSNKKQNVIIYGAGAAGRQLATALNSGPEFFVTGFVDDDLAKQNQVVQGIGVFGTIKLDDLVAKKNVTSILLALPSTTRSRRKEILLNLEKLPVKVLTIPGMADIVQGKANLEEFKEVGVEDLLGRDPVEPREELLAANIKDKVVLVTGAGGSIGSELCRQIIMLRPTRLVLFELSEYSLYAIEKELNNTSDRGVEILPILGSVQKRNQIENVLEAFGVQTIYHAAAYKHVPLVEHNVIEGVRNNVFGTLNTAKAAIKAEVETFVLISTDKAVRPTNVMGTTKRMAELVLQGLAKTQSSTRFSMVRFGNVLGSSGSVVPLFRKQIREGGPITLTHMDITRFFMTIPEASQLVIQAGAMAKGGDVFVLDMGESVKIYDLATKMVRLSGLEIRDKDNPDGDIEIKCTGLRPGEKLYEELLIGDNVFGTNHERIMTAKEIMLEWGELDIVLCNLNDACNTMDQEKIRGLLLDAPTGFNPTDDICDLVWQEKENTISTRVESKLKRVK